MFGARCIVYSAIASPTNAMIPQITAVTAMGVRHSVSICASPRLSVLLMG